MNPYLLIALSIGGFFKDSIKGVFKDKQLKTVIIALVAFVFIKKQIDAINRNKYLTGTLPESNFAVRLNDAFHPYWEIEIPFIGHLPDGTDEAACWKIAKEMNALKNFSAVAKAFKVLYNKELKNVLASEGVFDEFIRIYEGLPASKSQNVESYGGFKTGDKITVKLGHSIRDVSTQKTVKLGNSKTEYGIFTILINQDIAGIKNGVWANVYTTDKANGGKYYLVHIDGIKKA